MARKTGLGKGLDALIPGGEDTPLRDGVLNIRIDQIIANPRQPRTHMDSEELNDLAASIREHGVIQPLIVMPGPEADQYTLIAGERRWRASSLAGLESIPVIIRHVSEQQQLELALIENVQRADLSPLETAEAYHQLTEEFGLSHEEVAQRVGKSRVSVTNTLRLLKLPEVIQATLAEGKITEGHARAILSLPSTQAQLAVLQAILTHDLNVRQTEELVRKYSGQRPTQTPLPTQPPEIKELEERLRDHLGTKIKLNHGKEGGGSLTIYYYSDEELDHLVTQILREE